MRLAIPQLLKTQGNIINFGSTASISGAAAGAAYTASKHALLGLTRSTAFTYAKDGLRCNIVLPGAVETEIMKNSQVSREQIDQEGLAALGPYHRCIPKMCKPIDVARVVCMLATSPAVNGAEVTVDSGWTAA